MTQITVDRIPCWDGKTRMAWQFDDGGRSTTTNFRAAFTGDCVTRSIAIATTIPYLQVYDDLDHLSLRHERARAGRVRSNARTGVRSPIYRRYLASIGWIWHPTMSIGSGATVTLCEEDLPLGRLIVQVSKHLTAIIDHVVHDTHDPQRDAVVTLGHGKPDRIARRCVYGYFTTSIIWNQS